jgi:hypothetical protein
MFVKLFAVENIPQNHLFSEGKERNFSELITTKGLDTCVTFQNAPFLFYEL